MSNDDDDRALVVFHDSSDPGQLARLKALADARTCPNCPEPTDGPETYRGIPLSEVLRSNWDTPQAMWWRAGADAALDVAAPLLDDLADDEPCTLDHHGYCQMHGLPQPGPCPDGTARKLIEEARNQG